MSSTIPTIAGMVLGGGTGAAIIRAYQGFAEQRRKKRNEPRDEMKEAVAIANTATQGSNTAVLALDRAVKVLERQVEDTQTEVGKLQTQIIDITRELTSALAHAKAYSDELTKHRIPLPVVVLNGGPA